MEAAMMLDMLYGGLMMFMGLLLRRVFSLFDKLMDEDKLLHGRITDLSTVAVTRVELQGAIDRLQHHMDKRFDKIDINLRKND